MHTATYERLGVTVFARHRAVIKAASRKLKRKARFACEHRKERHAFYREMLACHRAALELVIHFRL